MDYSEEARISASEKKDRALLEICMMAVTAFEMKECEWKSTRHRKNMSSQYFISALDEPLHSLAVFSSDFSCAL